MAFDWKDLGQNILAHAPEIGAALGSVIPGAGTIAGGTAGAGIKAIAAMFGLSEAAKPEDIQAAIQADSQAFLKLKLADMEFVVKNRELDIAELKEKQSVYIEELRTKTVPMVDAIHKLGRQGLNLATIIVWCVAAGLGHVFNQYDLLILSVGNAAYQVIKGKGNQANGK